MSNTCDDRVAICTTLGEYRERGGVPALNDCGRVTLGTFLTCSDKQKGRGYLLKIENTNVPKSATIEQTKTFLKTCSDDCQVVEIYPVQFCSNERCGKASWHMIERPECGHSTCPFCGFTSKLIQNLAARHFDKDLDNGQVNKNMYNCTEGMDRHDCFLVNKKGKRMQIASQRIKSHQRHYWAILRIISDILEEWHWGGIESIERSAKKKAKTFYYSVHTEDNICYKMPHGRAQFAAACVFAAKLEFEAHRHCKTNCTLSRIREEAQYYIRKSNSRKTRDVTIPIIIKYTKMLKARGLCNATIPEITADTLRFKSKNVTLEHTRLAILNQCKIHSVRLPSDKSWGIKVTATDKGLLVIENVSGGGHAFKMGIKKGDYLFQINQETLGVEYSIKDFENFVMDIRKKPTGESVKISIMRKKK